MPTNLNYVTHTFGGGWATDYGQTIYNPVGQEGHVRMPFLTDARNLFYEFDGGPHKFPGTTALNTTVGASTSIYGLYEYWRQGSSAAPTQRRIIHAGTVIMHDQGTGSFTNLFTGLFSGAVPTYCTFNDLLITANDSTLDVPKSWDLTTAQSLAGSPPRFSFACEHAGRLWAAGDFSNPSRLYYSVAGNPEDWAGIGSGSIDVGIGDGDMITGLVSHQNYLFVFKGPNKLSIHLIAGRTPNDFVHQVFVRGVSAAWQNAIFRMSDDVGFISPRGSVHSLATTQKYGDFAQSYLSYPIGDVCKARLNHSRSRFWQAADDSVNGRVLIAVSSSGATTNDRVLVMDYRFLAQGEPYPRWSYLDAFTVESLAQVLYTSSRPVIMFGSSDGIVYVTDRDSRSHKSAAINYTVETPYFTYGSEIVEKYISVASLGVVPKNNNSLTFGWTRDFNAEQTQTVTQGQAGGAFDSGLFDTAVFGGSVFSPRFMELETGGSFRSIKYRVSDTANNSDVEIHSIAAAVKGAGWSTENTT